MYLFLMIFIPKNDLSHLCLNCQKIHNIHAWLKNNRNSILYDSSGYNESESESIMANNDSKYFPLTLEQEVIVTTCVTCLHTFTHAGASHLISKRHVDQGNYF